MLRIYGDWIASRRLPFHQFMHPDITAVLPLHFGTASAIDDDMADSLCTALLQCLIHCALQRDVPAAPLLLVGSNDQAGTHVDTSLVQAFGRESSEHNRVRDTQTGA